VTDIQTTDHATEKCVQIGEIGCTQEAISHKNQKPATVLYWRN